MDNKMIDQIGAWLMDPQIKGVLAKDLYSKLFGKLYGSDLRGDSLAQDLNSFPGEVSREERMYLYHFFATLWSGKKDVIEIGPFLGATTRAIAMGMLANPNRQTGMTLYTHDRFGAYYDRERLLETLKPLIDSGAFAGETRSKLEGLADMPDFQEIFEEIHSGAPYADILSSAKGVLPGSRAEIASTEDLFTTPASHAYDVVFIDGCKSWFATKYFIQEVSKNVEPGAYFIFQDFGWKSCFWLPVFWAQMSEYFEVISFVKTTYTFRLLKPLDVNVIEQRFPDDPGGFGRDNFNTLFPRIILHAADIGDIQGIVFSTLQHAAALAYIGEKDEARAIIAAIAQQPMSAHWAQHVKSASECPTYFPDGTPIRL